LNYWINCQINYWVNYQINCLIIYWINSIWFNFDRLNCIRINCYWITYISAYISNNLRNQLIKKPTNCMYYYRGVLTCYLSGE